MRIARHERTYGPDERSHVASADQGIERIVPAAGQIDERHERVLGGELHGRPRPSLARRAHTKEGICALQRERPREALMQRHGRERAGKEPDGEGGGCDGEGGYGGRVAAQVRGHLQ